MKIEQFQQLLMIVEKGSMNEAARELFLARSSLSTSMKHLEEELGVPIFNRHSSGVSLTPFGTNVYAQAKEICSRIGFLQSVSKRSSQVSKLTIASMYCSMANEAFADLLAKHNQEPLNASIEEMPLMSVIQTVIEGLCDIGILTLFSDNESVALRKIEDNGMEFHELTKRQLGAIIGPRNPLYEKPLEAVELAELARFPHLENYATPTDHSWEHRYISSEGYRANYMVSDLGLALRIVAETDAMMVDANDKEIYNTLYTHGKYRFIPIKDYPKCRTGWISSKHGTLSPLAEAYLSILQEKARFAT